MAVLGLAFLSPAKAANFDHARTLVSMIYDIGQYSAELDHVMDQSGRIKTTRRVPDRNTIRTLMLQEREAVLSLATEKVAARASDSQVDELLRIAAAAKTPVDPAVIDAAVAVVKSSFDDALTDQLARTIRGAAEFPCTKDQRSRC